MQFPSLRSGKSRDISIAWSTASNSARLFLWRENKESFPLLLKYCCFSWMKYFVCRLKHLWLVITCFFNWTAADFSTNLELQLCKLPKSAAGFFKVGESGAIYRISGITPVVTDKLTVLVIAGRRTEKQPLRTDVGRGSRQQDRTYLDAYSQNSLPKSFVHRFCGFKKIIWQGEP